MVFLHPHVTGVSSPVSAKSLSQEIPGPELFDLYDQNNVHLFFAIGKRDEVNDFKENVAPPLPRMQKMKHCLIFTPDWGYNGDLGIASINFGYEMDSTVL